MKVIILFSIIICNYGFIWKSTNKIDSKDKTENDLIKNNLLGPVKTLISYDHYTKIIDGEITYGSLNKKSIEKFNRSGNYISRISYDSKDNQLGHFLYYYNNKEQLDSELWLNENGSISFRNIYKYDHFNWLIEHLMYRGDTNLHLKRKYIYNENGFLKKEMNFDRNNKFESSHINFYNSKNLIEETRDIYIYGDTDITRYSYDTIGNLKEIIFLNKDNTVRGKLLYQYDLYKNIIDITKINMEEKDTSLTHYEYEYDEIGNWVKKIVFNDGYSNYIYKRMIDYYK